MTIVANSCTKMDFPNWARDIVTGVIIIAAVVLDRLRQLGLGGGLIPKSNDEFDQCAALAHQLLEVALKARESR
jgi:hypothetical protein